MIIRYSPNFSKVLKKKLTKQPPLKTKLSKQIKLFQKDMRHPSLKLHKLKGKRADEFSFWIAGDIRILFVFVEDCVYFTDIVTHDEY